MGETGFPAANLDPRAQEFFPTNYPPPHFYYPYLPPPPPPVSGENVRFFPLSTPCLPPQSTIPTRTLLVSMVPCDVSESQVRRELEVYGDVRAVQMERISDGIVSVHFYDLRHARAAAAEIQGQHMQQQMRLRSHFEAVVGGGGGFAPPPVTEPARGLIGGRAVWAQFVIPATCSVPEGNNQGTLVLLNLDSNVSSRHLIEIFRAFGDVKELRETPMKRHQRFIEFYDVRHAARALSEMNHKLINGNPVFIEFSRPGGHHRKPTLPFHSDHQSPPQTASRDTTSGGRSKNSSSPICNRNNNSKKGWNNKGSGSSSSSSPPGVVVVKRRGRVAGKAAGKKVEDEGGFMINGDEIKDLSSDDNCCKDSRTTVMIKNIPNKYSQKLLLNMLDNHCILCNDHIAATNGGSSSSADEDNEELRRRRQPSSYDFVYLPIDFINKCNVGYGFVNMTSPEGAWRLYKAFHLQTWEAFNSKKICEVTYARIQGIEALKEHFKNSRFPCDAEEYMPVLFSPPRNGRTLTPPLPIFLSPPPATDKDENENLPPPPAEALATLALNGSGDHEDLNGNYDEDRDLRGN